MFVNEPEIASYALQVIQKVWGTEFVMVNNERYCMKYLKVIPGYQCSIHAHKKKDETFMGISGTLRLFIHDKEGKPIQTIGLDPGKYYRIRPHTFHSFTAHNVTWVAEISTHHDDEDVIRLQESRKIDAQ